MRSRPALVLLLAAACSGGGATGGSGEAGAPDGASGSSSGATGSSSGAGHDASPGADGSSSGAGDGSSGSPDASDAASSSSDAPHDGPGEAAADAGAPDWSTEFAANGGLWSNVTSQATGSVTFGFADPLAGDGLAARLLFPGAPGLGSAARAGTSFATEIDSAQTFTYGTFRARLALPTCAATEDVVNGFFTYFNDGTDHNGNGIVDNSEIDIEILCGNPHTISLTAWTDYASDTSFLAMSRLVDLSTGAYSQTTNPASYDQTPMGTLPAFQHPEFPAANTYYEMGFDWRASELRFFIVLGGQEITLWDFTDAAHIPTLASQLMFNVWHPTTHWTGDNSAANYPANDAVAKLDWAKHWK